METKSARTGRWGWAYCTNIDSHVAYGILLPKETLFAAQIVGCTMTGCLVSPVDDSLQTYRTHAAP